MTIDHAVSAAVAGVHLIEMALHETGDWVIGWGPYKMPATREVLTDRIVFRTTMPSCNEPQAPLLTLYFNGDAKSVREIPPRDLNGNATGALSFEVRWELAVGSQPVAA